MLGGRYGVRISTGGECPLRQEENKAEGVVRKWKYVVENSSEATGQQAANEESANLVVCCHWIDAAVLPSSNPDQDAFCRGREFFQWWVSVDCPCEMSQYQCFKNGVCRAIITLKCNPNNCSATASQMQQPAPTLTN